jgi:chromosomal replication initiation ATPase DnaA
MVIADYIIRHVEKETGVTKNLILGKRRHQEIIDAKQIVIFALRELGFTQKFIGKYMNYADHSTVNHLINRRCFNSHENRLRATQAVRAYLDMALLVNACLREDLELKISGED